MSLPRHVVRELIERALAEDLGRSGDLTTDAVVPADATGKGRVVVREPGVIAGLDLVLAVFTTIDPGVAATARVADGDRVAAGAALAEVSGPARAILTGERTALNLLGRLSGIATATRQVADAIAGTGARVIDTRKSTPGLRAAEKYAVRVGGGANHRFGLDDGVLIKDNHLAIAGSVKEAVHRARDAVGHMVRIEVEVDALDQLAEALEAGVDAVLLDNMDLATLRQAVAMVDGRVVTEASGGIRPDNAAAIAATGVDLLSMGWLTQSAPALDVGLDF